jgi:DNA invertase Pin-like site-specific DNA recombinase
VPERQAKLYEQLAQIEGLCKRRRFELVGVVRDVEPNGDDVLERPGVRYAFEQFRAHRASALVVSDVRRLSVSRPQLDALLARLTAEKVALVALEPELDTSTEEGREVLLQLEIVRAERTKLADAEPSKKRKPAAQRTKGGSGRITRGGGPEADALKERIVGMRDRGESLKSIAEALNEEGVPPPSGGPRWRPSSVRASLGKEQGEDPGKVVRLNPPGSEPDEGGNEPGPNQRARGGSRRR